MLSDSARRRNLLPEAKQWNITFTIFEDEDQQGWTYSFTLLSALEGEHYRYPRIEGHIPRPVDEMRAIGIAWAHVTEAMISNPTQFRNNLFISKKKRGDSNHE